MFRRLFDSISRVLYGAAALALLLIVLLMIGRVFSRNLGLGWTGLQLYAQHLAGWLTFLVVGNLAWQREHIEIDYFTEKLPDRAKPIHEMLVSTLNIAVALVLMTGAIMAIDEFWDSTSPSVDIPIPLYYSAAVVGFGFLVIVWLHRIYFDIQVLRGVEESVEARPDARIDPSGFDTEERGDDPEEADVDVEFGRTGTDDEDADEDVPIDDETGDETRGGRSDE